MLEHEEKSSSWNSSSKLLVEPDVDYNRYSTISTMSIVLDRCSFDGQEQKEVEQEDPVLFQYLNGSSMKHLTFIECNLTMGSGNHSRNVFQYFNGIGYVVFDGTWENSNWSLFPFPPATPSPEWNRCTLRRAYCTSWAKTIFDHSSGKTLTLLCVWSSSTVPLPISTRNCSSILAPIKEVRWWAEKWFHSSSLVFGYSIYPTTDWPLWFGWPLCRRASSSSTWTHSISLIIVWQVYHPNWSTSCPIWRCSIWKGIGSWPAWPKATWSRGFRWRLWMNSIWLPVVRFWFPIDVLIEFLLFSVENIVSSPQTNIADLAWIPDFLNRTANVPLTLRASLANMMVIVSRQSEENGTSEDLKFRIWC